MMKNLTIEKIAKACDGEITGRAPQEEVTAVVTDSRQTVPGCLFAAIRGTRVNGHDFVSTAFKRQAACALVEYLPEDALGCMIRVDDVLTALQKIASVYRDGFDIPLVGVTGSAGKTTAKEMISAVLARKYTVHKTAGNYNNDLGVPLTLFGLEERHGAAVVELGVSHPGDMERIASIARPTMAVYTNIGDAHLEYLGNREGVLAEKSVMNRYLPEGGPVICNGDDPLLRQMQCPGPKLTFGLEAGNDLRAEAVEALDDGTTRCRLVYGSRRISLVIPAFGDHMVYAVLAAAAVGLSLGLTETEIAEGVQNYRQVEHRGRITRTAQITVIDDSYNANPTSMESAIRSLSHIHGRKVCILGDMLELGVRSDLLHSYVGEKAKEYDIDLVLAAGEEARYMVQGAGAAIGRHYPTKEALLEALANEIHPGDTILVKASRGMRFEDVAAELTKLFP